MHRRSLLAGAAAAPAFAQSPGARTLVHVPQAGWRGGLRGLLKGPVPVFWNVQKG